MAVGYFFALINRFDQDSHQVPQQLATGMGSDDPACRYERSLAHDKTIFIQSEQELVPAYSGMVEKRIVKSGRSGTHLFDFFYEPLNFVFYRLSALNAVAFCTGKTTAKAFMRKLRADTSSTLNLSEIIVDLSQVSSTIPTLTGAWVSGLRDRNPCLSSLGVFGTRVNESTEYLTAIEQGHVSAIIFNHSFNGTMRSAGVSRQGAVFIFERIKNAAGSIDTAAELAFMLDIYATYLSGSVSPRR